MKTSIAALAVGAGLLSSGCEKNPTPTSAPIVPAEPNIVHIEMVRVDPRALPILKTLSNTVAAILEISDTQEANFSQSGEWANERQVKEYEQILLQALCVDLKVEHEAIGGSDNQMMSQLKKLISQINKLGAHLYITQIERESKPYLSINLYGLDTPVDCHQLQEMKAIMRFDTPVLMQELVPAFSTAGQVSLYGSAGEQNIFIAPGTIGRDKFRAERDMPTLFKGVLINELAHLRLNDARDNGLAIPEDFLLQEAYSDYWTYVVNSEAQIIFAILDVLDSENLNYEKSKQFTFQALEAFGRREIPGFTNVKDPRFLERLITLMSNELTLESAMRIKADVLNAFRKGLIEAGYPESLLKAN